MKGRAGSFSFYSSKGRQVARVAQNSSNYGESARRSEAQQKRRVKWANLVNVYKLMSGTLHGAYETKRENETDYNAFMRKNLPLATIALTKDEAASGVAIPQAFIISEGRIQSSGLKKVVGSVDGSYVCRLKLEPNADYSEASVGTLTAALMDNNADMHVGVQISLICITLDYDTSGPVASFTRKELTLSADDERPAVEVLGVNAIAGSSAGLMTVSGLNSDAYYGMILSDSSKGELHVSSESLVTGDSEAENQYSSEEQVAKAMESYGVDAARFLDSGDYQ